MILYRVYANRMQAARYLIKIVSRYIKIHYEKYQNANFLKLIIRLDLQFYYHRYGRYKIIDHGTSWLRTPQLSVCV